MGDGKLTDEEFASWMMLTCRMFGLSVETGAGAAHIVLRRLREDRGARRDPNDVDERREAIRNVKKAQEDAAWDEFHNPSPDFANPFKKKAKGEPKFPVAMKSKFEGTCKACGQHYGINAAILWLGPERGCTHADCGEAVEKSPGDDPNPDPEDFPFG